MYRTEKWNWVITVKGTSIYEWNLLTIHCFKLVYLKSIKRCFYKSLERWGKGWACKQERKAKQRIGDTNTWIDDKSCQTKRAGSISCGHWILHQSLKFSYVGWIAFLKCLSNWIWDFWQFFWVSFQMINIIFVFLLSCERLTFGNHWIK